MSKTSELLDEYAQIDTRMDQIIDIIGKKVLRLENELLSLINDGIKQEKIKYPRSFIINHINNGKRSKSVRLFGEPGKQRYPEKIYFTPPEHIDFEIETSSGLKYGSYYSIEMLEDETYKKAAEDFLNMIISEIEKSMEEVDLIAEAEYKKYLELKKKYEDK